MVDYRIMNKTISTLDIFSLSPEEQRRLEEEVNQRFHIIDDVILRYKRLMHPHPYQILYATDQTVHLAQEKNCSVCMIDASFTESPSANIRKVIREKVEALFAQFQCLVIILGNDTELQVAASFIFHPMTLQKDTTFKMVKTEEEGLAICRDFLAQQTKKTTQTK